MTTDFVYIHICHNEQSDVASKMEKFDFMFVYYVFKHKYHVKTPLDINGIFLPPHVTFCEYIVWNLRVIFFVCSPIPPLGMSQTTNTFTNSAEKPI